MFPYSFETLAFVSQIKFPWLCQMSTFFKGHHLAALAPAMIDDIVMHTVKDRHLYEPRMMARVQNYCLRVAASELAKVLQSASECFRILQSYPEYFRALQSASECSRVPKSSPEYSKVLQNTPCLHSPPY